MLVRTLVPVLATLVALAWSSPTHAADDAASAAPAAGERSRIAAERSEVEARYTATERECERHFVVTSCVDDAKRIRREALDKLRSRQLVVDEAARHGRASERRKELADKIEEDTKRDTGRAADAAAAASSTGGEEGRAPMASGPARAASGAGAARAKPGAAGFGLPKPKQRDSAAVRQEKEGESRAAYEQRQADAEAHRSESTARTARRLAAKPAAAGLPTPAASQASGSTRTSASDKLSPDPRAR